MGRPVVRSAERWSLLQVAAAAGVTERAARTCAERGYVNAKELSAFDIAVLRVAACLLDTPRLFDGRRRTTSTADTAERDHAALAATARLVADQRSHASALLLIAPGDVLVADNELLAAGHLRSFGAVPVMVLPVGAWITEARSALTEAEPAEAGTEADAGAEVGADRSPTPAQAGGNRVGGATARPGVPDGGPAEEDASWQPVLRGVKAGRDDGGVKDAPVRRRRRTGEPVSVGQVLASGAFPFARAGQLPRAPGVGPVAGGLPFEAETPTPS